MAHEKKVTGQHKPTGQELDRQYDELHEEHDRPERRPLARLGSSALSLVAATRWLTRQ
jgi:hypothetical protein